MQSIHWTRRNFLKTLGTNAAVAGLLPMAYGAKPKASKRLPNIVIIYTDDQGYADVGCYGAKGFSTPNLDKMAGDGVRFTDFHVAQPVCSASRAALLTGCYSNRVGILGALGPKSRHGINENEMTLAEVVKQKDYRTAIFGKWHLGHHPRFLPMRHGFDEFFGYPYSHDMWPFHPENPKAWTDLPLMEGDQILEFNRDPSQLTTLYTERAVKFIEKNKDNPFFLYVPHNMPHVPLAVSDKYKGKTERGLYGDVISEIDWSVGQILSTLDKLGLGDNTLAVYASDNGPWLRYGDHGGSAKPLREGKGTTWDGGHRVPCIMRWKGKIPAGTVCKEPAMTIDILPTVAKLIDAKLPEHKIDGLDIWPLMAGQKGAKSPHEALYFYNGRQLQALRSGKWKLHFPHAYRTLDGKPGGTDGIPVRDTRKRTELALYDIVKDIGETTDVSAGHPEVVERLKKLGEVARADLGHGKKIQGSGVRRPGVVPKEKFDEFYQNVWPKKKPQ
jgi:arylsulfatase A